MKLFLNRTLFFPYGIFSRWLREDGSQLMVSVSHAVKSGDGWLPVVPPGEYIMRRYQSPEHGLVWEICDVQGHTNIEVHEGSWGRNSKGCECVGSDFAVGFDPQSAESDEMVINSRATLAAFMEDTAGEDVLSLTVNE